MVTYRTVKGTFTDGSKQIILFKDEEGKTTIKVMAKIISADPKVVLHNEKGEAIDIEYMKNVEKMTGKPFEEYYEFGAQSLFITREGENQVVYATKNRAIAQELFYSDKEEAKEKFEKWAECMEDNSEKFAKMCNKFANKKPSYFSNISDSKIK